MRRQRRQLVVPRKTRHNLDAGPCDAGAGWACCALPNLRHCTSVVVIDYDNDNDIGSVLNVFLTRETYSPVSSVIAASTTLGSVRG
jgi:hypothetical protein